MYSHVFPRAFEKKLVDIRRMMGEKEGDAWDTQTPWLSKKEEETRASVPLFFADNTPKSQSLIFVFNQ